MDFKVAVVGATGNVGREMLSVLAEREFPVGEIVALASTRSVGTEVSFGDDTLKVKALDYYDFTGTDIVLMSAGGAVSKEWSPRIASQGPIVIDNSSAWRMDPDCPLVVPEVNAHELRRIPKGIVANPNCTTMVCMPPLRALHDRWGLERVTGSTYQAVSGAGLAGTAELDEQVRALGDKATELAFDGRALTYPAASTFPGPIAYNVLPHAGSFDGDETTEELKFRHESRKILGLPDLAVAVTCVRVPVYTGHSLSLHLAFASPVDPTEAVDLLSQAPGVEVVDVPTPLQSAGGDTCMVGRVRLDHSDPSGRTLIAFIVGDNLRKGAALNAVQIAESLLSQGIVGG